MLKLLQNKIFIILLFFQLLNTSGFCQLTFNTSLTPQQLVQNILLQGGLSISNIKFTGNTGGVTSQIGSFTNASSTYLGLSSGVVITTGFVPHIAAAGNSGGNMSDTINSHANDADLASLAGGINLNKTFDAAYLEFDFIPTGNTISFNYVFGSEEEPKWVCSQYDDVFGFFLSGPGIAGPYSNGAVNIALIPGTNYPVSVNTVNSGTIGTSTTGNNCPSYGLNYAAYYVNNLTDANIVFGGLTTVLTAIATVIPCKTYHIKIAICDTGNGKFDSGVFLGANSFNSPDIVNLQPSYSNSTLGNNAIKGCSNGIFTFSTAAAVSSPMTINYIIGGTAVNGTDYATIPSSITIPTGQSSASLVISPLLNGSTGTVILGALGTCDTIYDTVKIVPYVPMNPITSGTATLCKGAFTTISLASNSGGIPAYTYNWSNGLGTATSYTVTPTQTTTYTITATDLCGQTESNDVTITVNNNVALTVTPTSPTICPGDTVTLKVTGAGNYTWTPATALSTTTGPTVIASPTTTTTYTVTGNLNGCSGTGQVIVNASNNLALTVSPSASICPGGSTVLTATSAATSYIWTPTLGLTPTTGSIVTANPSNTTTYTVSATKGGCSNSATILVTVNPIPVITPTSTPSAICLGKSSTLSATSSVAGTTYLWNPGNLSGSPTVTPVTTTLYTVTATTAASCVNTDTVSVIVNPNPTITPTASTQSICPGGSSTLSATSTIAGTTYLWNPGNISGSPIIVTPANTTTYTVTGTTPSGCTNTNTVSVTVNPNPVITPTASPSTICFNGSSTLSATSTVIGTTYSWNPGNLNGSPVVTPVANTTYIVTGTSPAGCSNTASVTVNITIISATADSIDEHCGQNNGTATVTPSGNCTQSWAYSWNTVPVQTTAIATHLPAGAYTVTVSCGACTTTASTSVNNLAGPSVSISSIVSSTCELPNGSATAAPNPATGTYNYLWSNTQTGQILTSVAAGVYIITITDANNCTATNSVTISTSPVPVISISSSTNADCGFPDGGTVPTVSSGTPPFSYAWNSTPPQLALALQSVIAGIYTLTVTDANGCTNTNSVTIGQNPGPTVTATSTNEICGQLNGTATAIPSGGVVANGYTYSWSNVCNTANNTHLAAGNYTVTISDGGCSATTTIAVNETPGPNASFYAYPSILTILDGPVYFHDNSAPNVVSWLWNFGDGPFEDTTSSPSHSYTAIGTYPVNLVVTDINGCTATISDTIKVKDIFTFYIPNAFTPNDDMFNDAFAPKGVNVDPSTFEMYIFDRWGNLMFHTNKWNTKTNTSEAWNGTLNNKGSIDDIIIDTYVYRITLKELEGPAHEYFGKIIIMQ